MDHQEVSELLQEPQGFVPLVESTDDPPFDKDDISGAVTYPAHNTSLGVANLILHQQYKDEVAESGPIRIRTGHDAEEPVMVLDQHGLSMVPYRESQKRGLFALNLGVVNEGGEMVDANVVIVDKKTGTKIKGKMHKDHYANDRTLFNEPETWLTYTKNADGIEMPIASTLLMVPRDNEFLSTIGFKFDKEPVRR